MKFDFTPTPWKYNNMAGIIGDTNNKNLRVANVYVEGEIFLSHTEIEANARLIACAPEMLEALIKLCDAFRIYNMDEYHKIIERATGKKIEDII